MVRAIHSLTRIWKSFWQPVRRFIAVSGYLWGVRNDPELLQVSRCYVHWLPCNLFSEPGQWLRQLLGTRQRYRIGKQRPYDIYVPHLHAPFPLRRPSASNWNPLADIHAEYLAIADREGRR